MILWVDADSTPKEIRALLVRQAERQSQSERHEMSGQQSLSGPQTLPDGHKPRYTLRFVGSVVLKDIPAKYFTQIDPGPDAADHFIEQNALPGDIVLTRDIPFAERLVTKNIAVLNDRGDIFSKETIAERRSLRDAAVELRLLGLADESPRGPRTRSAAELKRFSDALDRLITKLSRA